MLAKSLRHGKVMGGRGLRLFCLYLAQFGSYRVAEYTVLKLETRRTQWKGPRRKVMGLRWGTDLENFKGVRLGYRSLTQMGKM